MQHSLSSHRVSEATVMPSQKGYTHNKKSFTRYSGCSVLASAVAFLATVVISLAIVVILLAIVVTDTLQSLVPQALRRFGDLFRISI